MHYYQFNIADYRKDTVHLTAIEHYIYRTLIDWYYMDEKPIPKITQVVMRRLSLVSEQEANLTNVLNDFFVLGENGWIHSKIDEEIARYKHNSDVARNNGKQGGRPKKTQPVILANPDETTLQANHKPITNNHKPVLKENTKKSLPAIFENILHDVSKEVATDFIKQRKTKLTKTAVDGIRKQAAIAGLSLEDALKESCSRGWQSFKAEWIIEKNHSPGRGQVTPESNLKNTSGWTPPEMIEEKGMIYENE